MKRDALVGVACWSALALFVLAGSGCDSGGIGIDTPGAYDKIELGKPLPAEMLLTPSASRLGMSLCRYQKRALGAESSRELVRAAVDADGNVVASHCLRAWRHEPLLGRSVARARFTLDVLVPGLSQMPASAPVRQLAPGDSPGAAPAAAPQTVFARVTTVPAAATRPALRVAPASAPAGARPGPMAPDALAGASCLDAPLDQDLLAVAKALTFGKAPRRGLPPSWQEFGADMLARLNKERKSELGPPTDTVAASVADLLLMAEMMLQAIPAEGQEWMDHLVWKRLDLPGALENVPIHLPARAGQQSSWATSKTVDGSRMAVTLDLPYMIQTSTDVTFTHGTLYNLGGGHVRIVLASYRENGGPWQSPPGEAPPVVEVAPLVTPETMPAK